VRDLLRIKHTGISDAEVNRGCCLGMLNLIRDETGEEPKALRLPSGSSESQRSAEASLLLVKVFLKPLPPRGGEC
jgi:hypothetical protein